MLELITQIVGLMATAITVISFQCKSQKGIMTVQSISTTLWTVHFFMLGAFSGFLLNLLCAVRSVVYTKRSTHKWAASTAWIYIFTVLALVIYALQFTVFNVEMTARNFIVELLPTIGVIATNIGYRLSSGFKVRLSQFISSPVWLIYNVFSGSIGGVITEIISLLSAIIGMIRHDFKRMQKVK